MLQVRENEIKGYVHEVLGDSCEQKVGHGSLDRVLTGKVNLTEQMDQSRKQVEILSLIFFILQTTLNCLNIAKNIREHLDFQDTVFSVSFGTLSCLVLWNLCKLSFPSRPRFFIVTFPLKVLLSMHNI